MNCRTYEAKGTIPAGAAVFLNEDGTVSAAFSLDKEESDKYLNLLERVERVRTKVD